MSSYFFVNDTSTTEIYTRSLHDALPIYALNVNVPEIGVTLLEYGPFFTCDSSPSRSSPKALRIGAALSGKGNGPGRIWMTGPPPVTRIACNRSACSCDSLVSDASYPDATTLR